MVPLVWAASAAGVRTPRRRPPRQRPKPGRAETCGAWLRERPPAASRARPRPWLEFFLEGVARTANAAFDAATRIAALLRDDRERIGAASDRAGSALRVHDVLQSTAYATVRLLGDRTGVTALTVDAALADLARLGMVEEVTGRRRGRVFAYRAYRVYLAILADGTDPGEGVEEGRGPGRLQLPGRPRAQGGGEDDGLGSGRVSGAGSSRRGNAPAPPALPQGSSAAPWPTNGRPLPQRLTRWGRRPARSTRPAGEATRAAARAMATAEEEMDEQLPAAAGEVARDHPEVYRAYAALGAACAESGPIEGQALRLVKLALAIGAASEGGVHSHTRRGLAEGIPPEALRQVALLSIPTLGFPRAVAALTWIEDVTDPAKRARAAR